MKENTCRNNVPQGHTPTPWQNQDFHLALPESPASHHRVPTAEHEAQHTADALPTVLE